MRFSSSQPRVVLKTAQQREKECNRASGGRPAGLIPPAPTHHHHQGAVLLEVILALTLFVTAAAMLGAALSSAIDGVERQRLNTHAANLANSVLAEIQLGIRKTSESGATAFPAPFKDWTAEVIQSPMETETGETSGSILVEVVIRHQDPPLTHRLGQVIQLPSLPVSESPLASQ